MPVREVTNNLRVEANHVYVIPPNTNLGIARGVLKLQPRPETRTPHRSIDFFFESLAQDQRERAIGVILSGTATDGTLGLEAIKAEGGITFAQDDSARYDSMPRSAVAAGCVDFVLSPENIAKELARIAKHPYVAGQPPESLTPAEDDRAAATAHEDDETPLPSGGRERRRRERSRRVPRPSAAGEQSGAENGFKKILLLLRNHSGVDFSLYKSTTIQRRITRRMVLNKQDTLENYAHFLRGNAKELDALYSDVLISVTSFFRNPEAFDVLKRKVFPKLLQQRGDDPFRVWVLGCSTGQEAYSIAMAFVEAAEKAPRMRKLQVFATDLNDALLGQSPPRSLRQEPRGRCLAGTLAALFCRGGRRLPGHQVAARDGRLRPAESHQRPAFLAHGPDQLPQPADLSGAEFAEEGAPHVPLRAQAGGIFVSGRLGIHRRLHRPVRAGGQKAQDLFQESRADSSVSSAGRKTRR